MEILDNKDGEQDILQKIGGLASKTKAPIIRQINALAHKNSIRLGLGELSFPVAPELEEVFKNPKPEYYRYCPNAGVLALRDSVAKNYNQESSSENTLITIGVQQAMYVSLSALKKAGAKKVMIPEVNFGIYTKIPTELGMSVSKFKLNDNFSVDLEAFGKQVSEQKPDVIILNSPANPTGYVYSEEEMSAISEILLKYGNPFIISDDIYSKLTYGREFTPIFDKYENTIVVDGISKSGASAGLRVGWVYCQNKDFITLCTGESTTMVSSPPTINQYAALPIVKGETQETIDGYKKVLNSNFQIVKNSLQSLGIEVSDSMGGFYSFPNVSSYTGNDTEDFCKFAAAREDGVVVIPGKAFGRPTNIRISFATSEKNIIEGMKRLEKLLKEYKNNNNISIIVGATSSEISQTLK